MPFRLWRIFVGAIALASIAGCGAADMRPTPQKGGIVSLDACADQYVLALASPEDVSALSPEATAAHSFLREEASTFPQVRPSAEAVLALEPTLIVRAYGGGAGATALYRRAGIPVAEIGWASDIEGVFDVIRTIAAALGTPEQGGALIAEMSDRLERIKRTHEGTSVLYVTPGGVSTGPGSLISDAITKAGHTNHETRAGWHSLPLEHLARDRPGLVAAGFFDVQTPEHFPWSAARHPLIRSLMAEVPTVPLSGALTACAAWPIVEAVEVLATADPATAGDMAK